MAACGKQCYTLWYFNIRGRGELIRYMFHYARMPFTDKRLTDAEWKKFKPTAPLGQLPLLECTKEGKTQFLCQSGAIIRHVAMATGLNGTNPQETTRADEAYETLKEVMECDGRVMFEQDAARKQAFMKQMAEEIAPRNFGFLEKRLQVNSSTGTLAGGPTYTYADLYVAQFFDGMVRRPMMDLKPMGKIIPKLMQLAQTINTSPDIAAYLAKRPDSDM